jgi:glycosyltransferase involved in cell wall biosynthesis
VVVGGWPQPGQPSQTFVKAQVDALAALGVRSDIFVIRGPRGVKYGAAALAMRRRAQGPYDLVHAHYGFSGWVACCQRRLPVVVSFQGDDLLGTADRTGRVTPLSRVFVSANRRLAGRVDAAIVKSRRMGDVLAPTAAYVIPNGVDCVRFQPMPRQEACRRLGLDPGIAYVVFPSNPDIPVKNASLARQAYDRAALRVGVRTQLLTLGGVDHDEMPLYLNAASAILFTSYSEGSPNVVKEALACDARIVSVDVGDVAEMLEGVTGCAAGPYDAHWLGDRLTETLVSEGRSDGRRHVYDRGLDADSVARRILGVYHEVAAVSPS